MIAAPSIPGANFEEGDAGGMTVFLWGHPGVWKSTWCCQWPGVVFCSIASEGGDDALKSYPQVAKYLMEASQIKEIPPVFNVDRPPRFNIHGTKQLKDVITAICQNHKAWKICTVVVDGLSYLIDLWIDELIQHKEKTDRYWKERVKKQGGELFGPQDWGMLNMYLRSLRVRLGNEGLNVIWTTLQNDVYKSDPNNMMKQKLEQSLPMITGKNRVTLPGACKLHINAERTKIMHPTAMGRMITQPTFWTASTDAVDLRHKYFTKFPNGCLVDPEFGTMPTFRALWYELGEYIYVG